MSTLFPPPPSVFPLLSHAPPTTCWLEISFFTHQPNTTEAEGPYTNIKAPVPFLTREAVRRQNSSGAMPPPTILSESHAPPAAALPASRQWWLHKRHAAAASQTMSGKSPAPLAANPHAFLARRAMQFQFTEKNYRSSDSNHITRKEWNYLKSKKGFLFCKTGMQ